MSVAAPDLVKDAEFEHLHHRDGEGQFSKMGAVLHALRELGDVVHHAEVGNDDPADDANSHALISVHATEHGHHVYVSQISDEGKAVALLHDVSDIELREVAEAITNAADDLQHTEFPIGAAHAQEVEWDWGTVSWGRYSDGQPYVAIDSGDEGITLDPEHAESFAADLSESLDVARMHEEGDPTEARPLPDRERLERRKIFNNESAEAQAVAGLVSTPDGMRVRLGLRHNSEETGFTGGRSPTTVDLDEATAREIADVLDEFDADQKRRQKVYDKFIAADEAADEDTGDVNWEDVSGDVRDELGGDFDDDFDTRNIETPWGTLRLTDVGMDDEANAHSRHVRVEIWPAGMSEEQYDAGGTPDDLGAWRWPGSQYEKPTADLLPKDIKALAKLLRASYAADESITKSEGVSTMGTTYAWAPITKSVKQDDGTLMVYGPASDASLDRDGQRMNQAWLDKAMPRWKAEGGNIREQHDPKRAVGVAVGLTKDAGSGAWMLASHIVDPVAVKKVEAGVLRGYSIGIKEPHLTMGKAEAPNGEVDGGYVCEVSIADRPSNPLMLFTMVKADRPGVGLEPVENPVVVETEPDAWDDEADGTKVDEADLAKRDFSQAERDKAADNGDAMSNGSFPIETAKDLKNAIHLAGNAKDPAAARRHIISRARALGLTDQLPEDWDAAEKADAALIARAVAVLLPDLIKTELSKLGIQTPPVDGGSTTDTTPDLVKAAVAEAIKAPEKRAQDLASQVAQLEARMAAMPQPGGPVLQRTAPLVRPHETTTNQRQQEAAALLAKADRAQDPVLIAGYRQRARELLKADN